jgi:hypothetical protein
MGVLGVVEIAVGIGILTAVPVLGAYVASAWLLLVAVNLVIAGHLDVAVRDVVLSIAAFTLARLIQIRAESDVREAAPHLSLGHVA